MTNLNAVYEAAKRLQPPITVWFELTKMIPPNVLARADRVTDNIWQSAANS
jgi:hypothetical protein